MTVSKTHACLQCDYVATQKSHLTRHLRSHTGERPYKCDQCGYRAIQKAHLTVHSRVHTGERPFACKHCDYKAGRKDQFTRHQTTCAAKILADKARAAQAVAEALLGMGAQAAPASSFVPPAPTPIAFPSAPPPVVSLVPADLIDSGQPNGEG